MHKDSNIFCNFYQHFLVSYLLEQYILECEVVAHCGSDLHFPSS